MAGDWSSGFTKYSLVGYSVHNRGARGALQRMNTKKHIFYALAALFILCGHNFVDVGVVVVCVVVVSGVKFEHVHNTRDRSLENPQ